MQYEPWLERDRVMIDTLATIGIVKGRPFAPDAETARALDAAAAEAHELLDEMYEESVSTGPFVEGNRWAFPENIGLVFRAAQAGYVGADVYPVDSRGLLFTFIFFVPKRLGEGQFYLMAFADEAGRPLEGSRSYRLTVPPNAPVRHYWSATLYDRDTHALIPEMSHAGRSSQSRGLEVNPDGSVDLFFGPEAPAGREANWTPTAAGRPFEILFRFYGPLPPLFEKTWVLPDVEAVP